MCGIFSLTNLDNKPIDLLLMKRMCSKMEHRGPDGEGFWSEKNLFLGHKRLKILDLSENGKQPMLSNNNRYVLSYNGEVYNYKKIKKDLIKKGYTFKSKTDSEVIINAYQEWGTDCFNLFDGIFAIIIWDRSENKLTVARDRYGTKPLYYFNNQSLLIFSSEIKPILTHPHVSVDLNKNALDQYFTFQNNLNNETLFKDINMVDAGTFMIYDLNKKTNKATKFWEFNFEEDHSISKNDAIEEVDRLFKLSVEKQLMSDVPIGSYLSGGMDSGAITAVASTKFDQLKTFTIGFDMKSISGMEINFDERSKAKFLSDLYKTNHYESILSSNDMESCLGDLIPIIENPVVGQSYPNYYAAKLAKKHVTVVFSGVGGDELFAGYPWRYQYSSNNKNPEEYIGKYYKYWSRILHDREKRSLYKPSLFKETENYSFESFAGKFNEKSFLNTNEDYINKSLHFECQTFLQGLLTLEDKISMSFGLETRVPFLDNDLVDFAMKIPIKHKLEKLVHNEETFTNQTSDGKIVLRRVFENYVTKEYSNNKKQGFSGPDGSWFKGNSIEYVRGLIKNKDAAMYNYLDFDSVANIVDIHFSGRDNKRLLIWSLINFEIWLNTFLND